MTRDEIDIILEPVRQYMYTKRAQSIESNTYWNERSEDQEEQLERLVKERDELRQVCADVLAGLLNDSDENESAACKVVCTHLGSVIGMTREGFDLILLTLRAALARTQTKI